jgi:hypothetical protein
MIIIVFNTLAIQYLTTLETSFITVFHPFLAIFKLTFYHLCLLYIPHNPNFLSGYFKFSISEPIPGGIL